MTKKESKTIVSTMFGKWTVYALESTDKEGFIEFFAKMDDSSITHWLVACQGSIDEVDEDLLFGAFHGLEESLEFKERAVDFVAEVEFHTLMNH